MKTLRDYRVTGALYVNDTGVEAQVSDQVTLFLDTDAEPGFPESIVATIQHPITTVECGSVTSYIFEYDEADLDGASALLRAQDIIDATVVSGVTVVADELNDEIADRIAADAAHEADSTAHPAANIVNTPAGGIAALTVQAALNELDTEKAPKASPTFAGTVTLGDGVNVTLNATTGTKIGTAITERLAFHNSTPVVQRAGAAQAAVVATSTDGVAAAASADLAALAAETEKVGDDARALIALVNELRSALVEKGLIKGAA